MVLGFAALLLNVSGFMRGQDWGDDFAGYVIQAQALQSGDMGSLERHISRNDFILNYPWGFPVLLLPVISFFWSNLLVLKLYIFCFFILSMVVTYVLFRRQQHYALPAVIFLCCSPYLWYFKNYVLSDYPHLFFVLLSLCFIRLAVTPRATAANEILVLVMTGFCLFAAYSVRNQSVVLIPTLMFMQVWTFRGALKRPQILLFSMIPYVTFFILNRILRSMIGVDSIGYLDAYSGHSWIQTVWFNLFYYVKIWQELFRPMMILGHIAEVAAGFLVLFFFIGILKGWRENILFIVFVSLAVGMLLLTPFYQDLRYLLPVVPVVIVYFVKGVFETARAVSERFGLICAKVVTGSMILLSFGTIARYAYDSFLQPPLMDGPYQQSAMEMFNFLRERTADSSLVGFWKPRAMLLYGERNGRIANSRADLERKNIQYYVHYNNAYADQIPIDSISQYPAAYRKVFGNDQFTVFKVRQGVGDTISPSLAPETLVKMIDHSYFDPSIVLDHDRNVAVWSNSAVSARPFTLPRGHYYFTIISRGTPAGGEFPLNQVIVNDKIVGSYYNKHEFTRYDVPVVIDRDTNVVLKLRLQNDICENGEDRNTIVQSISIYRRKAGPSSQIMQ